MPWNQVLEKFETGRLHSGSKSGPKINSRKQAIAVMLSEKRAAAGGKSEYKASGGSGASKPCKSCMGRKVIAHSPPVFPMQTHPMAPAPAMGTSMGPSLQGALTPSLESPRRFSTKITRRPRGGLYP